MILYITSHKDGRLLGTREAEKDIKQPERLVIPPYQTPNDLPRESLDVYEFWAYLDKNNKPVRNYQLGAWVKQKCHVKVIAYLKNDATKQQEFDDVSLISDDYTKEKPLTQWDEWNGTAWVTNQSNKYIAEYDQVDSARRAAYRNVSDPLYMEALRKEARGLTDDAADFRNQADAAVELIKAEFPWPTQVEVS